MRHVKFIILESLCQRWEQRKISSIEFAKLTIDLVLNNWEIEDSMPLKERNIKY